jgi:hypothetical protein
MVCAAQGLVTQVGCNTMKNNALHFRLRYLRNAEAVLALALPGALAWRWVTLAGTAERRTITRLLQAKPSLPVSY